MSPGAVSCSFVDVFYVHAYNYNVSANANRMESTVTAPAQPVRDSEYGSSVTSSLADYVSTGVTASKLVLVVAAHGQSYHLPDALRDGWAKFGLATTVTGSCGGPYSSSHGAFPSAVTGRCGEITNIEVMVGLADASSAVPDPTLDDATGSNIAFFPKTQTWISFTGRTAMQGLAAAMQAQGGGGLALYTLDMDVMYVPPPPPHPFGPLGPPKLGRAPQCTLTTNSRAQCMPRCSFSCEHTLHLIVEGEC